MSLGTVGGGLSGIFTLSRDLSDFRGDGLVGACVVTTGWVETGIGSRGVGLSVG